MPTIPGAPPGLDLGPKSREIFRKTRLTIPMVLVGMGLGSLVCVVNMYFGLQIGTMDTMSTSTAILAFAIFKTFPTRFSIGFTPTENAVVQTIASSIAGMPFTGSLTGVVPAFEFLRKPEEGAPKHFDLLRLTLWTLGLSLFGVVFAAPFRKHFIINQSLRYPGGYATGILINLLHGDRGTTDNYNAEESDAPPRCSGDEQHVSDNATNEDDNPFIVGGDLQETEDLTVSWASKIQVMLRSFCATAVYVFASYFFPAIQRIPVFGTKAAADWLWYLTLSPSFMSFGVLLPAHISASMVLGAIIGWGILSPLAKNKGWAPGPVDDMETGSRMWLVWISVAFLLGDSVVRILVSPWMPFLRRASSTLKDYFQQLRSSGSSRRGTTKSRALNVSSRQPLLEAVAVANPIPDLYAAPGTESSVNVTSAEAESHNHNLVSRNTVIFWLIGSTILCQGCTILVFGREAPFYLVFAALLLTLPLCLVSLQSVGETDHTPSTSLSNLCQFLFVLMIPKSYGTRFTTLVAGAIIEAGLWQSAVLMTDLKTAYLVHASPSVMFRAQILGSIIGAFVSSGIYRSFAAIYKLPSKEFPIPLAFMWSTTARFASGGDIPKGIWPFLLFAFLSSAALGTVGAIAGKKKPWRFFIPSGIAISIGMLVPPSITLAKFIGSVAKLVAVRRFAVSEASLMTAATGCILGEGLLGFLPFAMAKFGVPRSSDWSEI